MRKAAPHQNASSSTPPISGPMVMPPMKQLIQIAIAVPRARGSGNIVRISPSVEGMSVAPATPSSARVAISIAGPFENAAITEATPNAAAPMSSSRRRPMRSPSVPIVTRKPAIMKP